MKTRQRSEKEPPSLVAYDASISRPCSEIQADLEILRSFADAYRLYYTVPDEDGVIPVYAGDRDGLRRRIHRQLGRAEKAMKAAGVNEFGIGPPPAVGGPGRLGLVATAFAYDEPQFQGDPPIYHLVLDRVELAIGVLEHDAADSADQRGAVKTFGRGLVTAAHDAAVAYQRGDLRRERMPKLLIERLVDTVPRWALRTERLILFVAGVAAIVATVGLAAGWWSS
ncbi:MAG: hypothetical protein ACR2L3_04795 [Actinomycetota bacterium]